MPRFIAKYRRYMVGVREHIVMNLANGKSQVMQHGVNCEFSHGGAFNHEKELAKKTFKFKGLLQELDEATHLDPIYGANSRISVFDTDSLELVNQWKRWDRAEGQPEGAIKKQVEEALRASPDYGRDFIVVEQTKMEPPYAMYDKHRKIVGKRTVEHAVKDITAAYETAGFDVDQAVEYERQESGPEALIAVLLGLKEGQAPAAAPEELVAA